MTVVLINSFEVARDQADEFTAAWRAAADFLAGRPGYLSTRLHRALSDDTKFSFVNVAEWESEQACRAAVTSPEFRPVASALAPYPGQPAFYSVAYEDRA